MSKIQSSSEHLTLNADGSSKDIKFQANGVEKASISSTGVMTATSFAGSGAALTGVGVAGISSSADATAITIDSSENVGIGTTPETGQGSNSQGLYVGTHASVISNGAYESVSVSENAYLGTAANDTWKYRDTSHAARHEMKAGVHTFKVAPSGTADADITWTNAMTIDNSGAITMPNQPAFSAYRSSGVWNGSSTEVMVHNGEDYDVANNHSTSTGKFTAPTTGKYLISWWAMTNDDAAYIDKHIDLRINNTTYKRIYSSSTGNDHHQWSWSGVVHLSANDYVDMGAASGSLKLYGSNAYYSHFGGYLLG